MSTANKSGQQLAGGAYSFRQLEELWIAAGGNRTEAPLMASIALAESGGHANATNRNTNGTTDRGLWQINSTHGTLSTYNPLANAKAAVSIRQSQGLSAWTTYNTGAYKTYLNAKNLLSGIKQGEGVDQSGFLASLNAGTEAGLVLGVVPGAAAELLAHAGGAAAESAAEAIGFSWSSLTSFAVTAVLLLAGAVLVVYGIMVAVRPREGALSLPKMPVPVPV